LAGDSIEFFTSYKYKQSEMDKMFQKAGLRELKSWKAPNEDFCKLPANNIPRKRMALATSSCLFQSMS